MHYTKIICKFVASKETELHTTNTKKMKANTDFGNLRIFDVIPFYEEYDIEKVIFHFCDTNHGYIRFQINGVTPEKSPYAATRVFTTKNCVKLAKQIQKLNRHDLDNSIEGTREIEFVNFGNLI